MPQAGYKFNTRFVVGVGGSYRAAFKDSIHGLVSKTVGYKAFSSYDVIGNFFLYTEFNRNTLGRIIIETGGHLIWKNSWLVGAGKKISVSPKLDMTMVVAYNFFYKPGDPLYPRPLVVRVGFQSSDVALLRRK